MPCAGSYRERLGCSWAGLCRYDTIGRDEGKTRGGGNISLFLRDPDGSNRRRSGGRVYRAPTAPFAAAAPAPVETRARTFLRAMAAIRSPGGGRCSHARARFRLGPLLRGGG